MKKTFIIFSVFILALMTFVIGSMPKNWEEIIIGATSEKAFIITPRLFFRTYINLAHPFKGDKYNEAGQTPLHFAISYCAGRFRDDSYCPELIENILESGAKINAPEKNKLGLCPLHLSVLFNDQDLFKFLIKHGADPEAKAQGEKYKDQNIHQFAQKLNRQHFLN